jgi:unsaturated rhamnogalacturonyl hydrolase
MNTDWGQSLLAYGLLEAVRTTGNEEARGFLSRWLTYHLGAGVKIDYFVGSWSIGLLYPDVADLIRADILSLRATAERIYDVIRRRAIRNGNGVILHNIDLPHIYIDTIYYSVPVLARLGTFLGHSDWRTDAMSQLRNHLAILRDPESGFFIHCQQNLTDVRSEGAWGRGNGWVAMTCAELLPHLKANSKERHEVALILQDLCTALVPLQTRTGMWRTILTDRTSYKESSATAMFLFALIRARRERVLPASFDEIIDRALRGLTRMIDEEGRLIGTSEGTWPGTIEYYKSLATGEWWWGTGSMMIALAEMHRYEAGS